MTNFRPFGTNIFEQKWDLLIILDACRYDAMCEISDEYSWIDYVGSKVSVGSRSNEWMIKTFKRTYIDEIQETAYISGNPYTEQVLENNHIPEPPSYIPNFWPSDYNTASASDFRELQIVWRDGIDEKWRCVLPRTMTERAVLAYRQDSFNRIIIHYMQPHTPHIGPKNGLGHNVFPALRNGSISKQTVWNSYIENLKLVLDEVEILLQNIDADKVVITSDHGEAFGMLGFFGHQIGNPFPSVKKVPWVETAANDHECLDVGRQHSTNASLTIDQHLADLGYK